MQHPVDRLLLETWLRTHDESVFRLIYHRHARIMWKLALRLSDGNAIAAEEITQDAWLRAVEKFGDFQWKSSLRTWLCGIVLLRWKEEFRKIAIQQKRMADVSEANGVIMNVRDMHAKVDIEKALDKLPVELKDVLLMHDVEGFKHQEIAAILDIAVGTSKSRLAHAKRKLKDLFH